MPAMSEKYGVVGFSDGNILLALLHIGNELNLQADGCSYSGLPGEPARAGAYFSTHEMMAFARTYVSWIKALDPHRPVGSDMGKPRPRAAHLAATPGGGAKCVSKQNPQGDCEHNCTTVPHDTREQYQTILAEYSAPFDLVSIHDYGCYPPFAEYSFCDSNASIATLEAAKEVADQLGKPLFVGELGSPACVASGWASDECLE